MFVSEYGGIKWSMDASDEKAWGYGNGPKTEEEFLSRYKGLTEALLSNPKMFGFCYTQLTDVEQEQNGIADRTKTYRQEASGPSLHSSYRAARESECCDWNGRMPYRSAEG